MDPLSIAASIAGLIALTELAVTRGSKILRTLKEAPETITVLVGEVAALSGILSSLVKVARESETQSDSTSIELDVNKLVFRLNVDGHETDTELDAVRSSIPPGLLQDCFETLQHLQEILSKLEQRPKGVIVNTANKFWWLFIESKVTELLSKIERHKVSFLLALSVDDAGRAERILRTGKDVASSLKDLKGIFQTGIRTVMKMQQENRDYIIQRDTELRHAEILKFLSTVNYSQNHETATKLGIADSGKWLINGEKFQKWLKNEHGFLWISGIAGVGKTILTSTMIREVQRSCKSKHDYIAYFYCDFKDATKQDPTVLLGSLVRQLIVQTGYLPESLEKLYESQSRSNSTFSLETLLDQLRIILENRSKKISYILIDALDECNEREDLLQGLLALSALDKVKLNLLVTSRKENDIHEAFKGLPSLLITETDIQPDVEKFVKIEIERHSRLKNKTEELKSKIITKLVEEAHGMFRWVKCQMDVLSKAFTNRDISRALEDLPAGLEETYDRILEKIEDGQPYQIANNILTWLIYSSRPLSLAELAEAIIVETDENALDIELRLAEARDVFEICGSLLAETADKIGLAHYTVKEYLESRRLLDKPTKISRYAKSMESGHHLLAEVCLTYLAFDDFASGPCQKPSKLMKRHENYPLYLYACDNWGIHAEKGKVTPSGFWDEELFQIPQNNKLKSILEAVSYQRHKQPDAAIPHQHFKEITAYIPHILLDFGFRSYAKKRIEDGCDVNIVSERHGTMLALAALNDDLEMVKLLLEKGADPNLCGGYIGSPIIAAATNVNAEMIQLLLSSGANVNAVSGLYISALIAACSQKGPKTEGVVKLLLEHDAEPNPISTCYFQRNALLSSIWSGNIEVVKMLLDRGEPVQRQDMLIETPLLAAVEAGNPELVQFLIDHGANVNEKRTTAIARRDFARDVTPLLHATAVGDSQLVRLLLDNGADPNLGASPGVPLTVAIHVKNNKIIDMLLDAGANVNGRCMRKGCPLSSAVRASDGDHSLVQRLLDLGADPNGTGYLSGIDAPVAIAVDIESSHLLELLIKRGANPSRGYSWNSPVYVAAEKESPSMLQKLLEHGADPNIIGGNWGHAIFAALEANQIENLKILFVHGADPLVPDLSGNHLGDWFKRGKTNISREDVMALCPDAKIDDLQHDLDFARDHHIRMLDMLRDVRYVPDVYEAVGRSLFVLGYREEAGILLEQRILPYLDEIGIFIHEGIHCNGCLHEDWICGPRHICKDCLEFNLCMDCYENMAHEHFPDDRKCHEFLAVPGPGWKQRRDQYFDVYGDGVQKLFAEIETIIRTADLQPLLDFQYK